MVEKGQGEIKTNTPFFRNGLGESNCLIICLRSPRLGSSRSFLPASFCEIFTSIEATCSKESPDRDEKAKNHNMRFDVIIVTYKEQLQKANLIKKKIGTDLLCG